MNELYQKVINYVYEIRMIELDEYIYGMNRKKIDVEKAYEMIIDAPDSECNVILNVWKGRFADPELPFYKSSRVEKNQSRAKAFYRKAVELDIEGMAEAGDQYAQECLGYMYYYGSGVDENESTAVEWYRKAAEQGYATAQFYLGLMYHYGRGVDKNEAAAVEWYRNAAEQGHAESQYNLGLMNHYGSGVDKNESTAAEWYRNAAEQGHASCLL